MNCVKNQIIIDALAVNPGGGGIHGISLQQPDYPTNWIQN